MNQSGIKRGKICRSSSVYVCIYRFNFSTFSLVLFLNESFIIIIIIMFPTHSLSILLKQKKSKQFKVSHVLQGAAATTRQEEAVVPLVVSFSRVPVDQSMLLLLALLLLLLLLLKSSLACPPLLR